MDGLFEKMMFSNLLDCIASASCNFVIVAGYGRKIGAPNRA